MFILINFLKIPVLFITNFKFGKIIYNFNKVIHIIPNFDLF